MEGMGSEYLRHHTFTLSWQPPPLKASSYMSDPVALVLLKKKKKQLFLNQMFSVGTDESANFLVCEKCLFVRVTFPILIFTLKQLKLLKCYIFLCIFIIVSAFLCLSCLFL